MNQTKRKLESIAAVFSIVLGAFLAIGSLAIIAACNNPEMLNEVLAASGLQISQDEIDYLKTVTIILMLFAIAIVVVGALLAKSPLKNGVIRKRLGLQIALAILVGIAALLELMGGNLFWAVLFAVPLVLIIVSICQKHPEVADTTTDTITTIDEPRE